MPATSAARQRETDVSASRPLTLTDVTPLAQSLARRLAHRPDDVDDLIQVGLFAYHTETENRKRRRIRKPWAFARTILHRAMLTYYYGFKSDGSIRLVQSRAEWKHSEPVELFGFQCRIDGQLETSAPDALLALSEYFAALEASCGSVARMIAENLVEPNHPCITGFIIAESRAKQMLRSTPEARAITKAGDFRKLPRGGGTSSKFPIPITHARVRNAMGLSALEWSVQLEKIRSFTRQWFTDDVEVAS